MKFLRYLLMIALATVMSGVAKADDFQMVIIDPLPAPGEIHFITNPNFAVTLSPCHADQLNGFSTSLYLGCFTGLNDTGVPLTSLEIVVPLFDLNGHVDTPSCATVTGFIFSHCTYTTTPTDYILNFFGGSLPTAPVANGDCDHDNDGIGHGFGSDDVPCNAASLFTIAVGVGSNCGDNCASLTRQIDAGFNQGTVAIANAPEPNSFLLMATGALSVGLFAGYRRRQIQPLTRRI